mmetsp:Transcript_69066/g.200407  ORF Transcript_69066/g.200407 Transcript_69066/m.200407 type:complete len:349 (+) Transcript_69066:92-1138(+)
MKSFFQLLFLILCGATLVLGRTEEERIAGYHARNYTYPLEYVVPNTRGWRRLQEHRMNQVAEIPDRTQRFEGWAQAMQMAVVAPNFTEFGFSLARAPDGLMEDLREAIRQGLEKGPRTEKKIDVIDTAEPSWFIDRPDMTNRVLHEMQPYVETWSNTELTAWGAYGFRLYRNNSKLQMHVDRSQSHVISFILHIASSEDAEPWPIVIEDLHGRTHEVILTSGDVLLYESSKCLHGRPRRLNGSWYTSVFVHYYPKHGWNEIDHQEEKVFAIPPHWEEVPTTQFEIPLRMIGTGLTEPSCPDAWCQLKYSKKWGGPGKAGYLMTPAGEELPFEPKRVYSNQAEQTTSSQ